MNDPTCPARNSERHVCTDKNGEMWDRPGIGPRPGTRCDVGTAVDLAKSAAMDALGALMADAMPDVDDYDDCGLVLGQ